MNGTPPRSWARRWGPPAAGVAATAGLGLILYLQVTAERLGGVGPGRYRLLTYLLVWAAVAVVVATLLRWVRPRKLAAALVVASVIALPAASLTRGSQISDDMYRYAWDGRLQAAGIDPYRYPPNSGELLSFRDDWLWPDIGTCLQLRKKIDYAHPQHACTRINRPPVRTIYPPVAEGYFLLAHAVPGPPRDHRLQLDAAVLSAALVGLLAFGLRRLGRDPLAVAYYSFGPLAGLDIAADAHVDVLAAIFGVGAVLLASLRPQRSGRVGLLAGLSIATKLYPVLLLPALVRPQGDRSRTRRGALRLVGAVVAVLVIGYLPHVLAVGPKVLGYLPGYLHEENYDSGSRFLLLGLLGLGETATKVLAVAVLAAVAGAVAWRSWRGALSPPAGALAMFGAAFLVATPAQPWYALMLVCAAILAGRLEWLAVAVAPYPLYFTALLHENWLLAGRSSYAAAAAAVLVVVLVRAARQPRSGSVTNAPIPASKDTVGAQSSSARAREESAVMWRTSPNR